MATVQNIDWHSDSREKLYSNENLISCDFLHVPDLIKGNLILVRQNHCTGLSLNQCEVIDPKNIIVNWTPMPLVNVTSYQTIEFKNRLLNLMYRDLNDLENELLVTQGEFEENKNDKDNEMKKIKQTTKVLCLALHTTPRQHQTTTKL